MVTLPDTVMLDASDASFAADRYSVYRSLRETRPVAPTMVNGRRSWLITGLAEVERVLKDPTCLVEPEPGAIPAHVGTGAASEFYRYSLPNMDPPTHTRLRKLASPAFAPRAMKAMRGWVEEIIVSGLDRLAELGDEVDFVHEYAARVPAMIACRLLHAPMSDAETVLQRMPALNAVLSQSDISPQQLADADSAAQFYIDYIGDLVDSLRGTLDDDDAVGALLNAEADGARLSRMELVITLVGFFIASYHTTMVAMTNAVNALLRHPDQYRQLTADPSLAPLAWEETLRFDSPVHFIWRYAGPGLELNGIPIPEGDHLLLGLAAANRDSARFDDPDRYDITRTENKHVAFTAGGHYCLGAPLSRLEGDILLRELPRRLPGMQLREEHLQRLPDLTFPVITRLMVSPRGAR